MLRYNQAVTSIRVSLPFTMKSKPLVIISWVQVVLVAAFLGLSLYNNVTRPSLQFDYSRATGRVTDVTPGGAGERGGIRVGDVVMSIRGIRVGHGISPLLFARRGDQVPVVIQRWMEGSSPSGPSRAFNETRTVSAVSYEQNREAALRRGGGRTLWAISSYIFFPLNIWMLILGITLLVLRPGDLDARLSGLALVYWAGGNFVADSPGIGALLAPLPQELRAAYFLLDCFFVTMFFSTLLHFAVVFPSGERRVPRAWQIAPYLFSLPIFLEGAAWSLSRLDDVAYQVPSQAAIYKILGPSLLVIALVLMAWRFNRTQDLNSRRRLKLVFLALLPGVFGWIVASVLSLFDNFMLDEAGTIINQVGVIAGSAIFTYAVVRHRMFNIRVLVRRGIRYAMARGTLLALMSLPVIGLAAYLYVHRSDSIAVVLTGTPVILILIIVPFALVISYRRRLLESLDRRYFREQYDARQLLLQVVSMVRGGSDILGLSRVALDEIDRALHPKHISLWHADIEGREYVRHFVHGSAAPKSPPPLPTTGALPTLLSTDEEPLDLHSRHTRPLVRRLPQAERDWLHDADAYLIVPMLIEQRLAGMMVLGERMSEEPYGSEDRKLLRTLAAQLALTFDYSRLKGSPSLVWGGASPRTPPPMLDEVRSCPACGRCFAADQTTCEIDQQTLVREEGVPRTIDDKYLVTRLLGRGGMGSVYMATQKRLNRPVAVKVLLSHLVGSSSMRGRFEREARIVARLRHPGIVTIHDFGVLSAGHAYLVMEYLEGQTLRKTILSGPQSHARMLEIMRPVIEAVEAAHRAGVVHRDLKPENIMIVPDRETDTLSPRVLDFGLAKMTGPIGDDEATIVQSGQSVGIVGTLMYIAPEILGGQSAAVQSDQYSLALIAYELLAGVHPFNEAADLATIVRCHTMTPVPPLRDHVDVPDHVAAAIHRALSKEAEERFESVSQFLAAMS
jgi:predicted Ser/Thr protein kinase